MQPVYLSHSLSRFTETFIQWFSYTSIPVCMNHLELSVSRSVHTIISSLLNFKDIDLYFVYDVCQELHADYLFDVDIDIADPFQISI